MALSWTAASDTQTAASGLSYNLRAGTAPGGANVLSPMATASGLARLSLKDGLDLPQAALSALGAGFSGSVWVSPSAGLQVAGVAQTVWPAEGRAAGYAGLAAP